MADYGVDGNTDHDFNGNGFRDFECADASRTSNPMPDKVEDTTGIILGLYRAHRHPDAGSLNGSTWSKGHHLPALCRGQSSRGHRCRRLGQFSIPLDAQRPRRLVLLFIPNRPLWQPFRFGHLDVSVSLFSHLRTRIVVDLKPCTWGRLSILPAPRQHIRFHGRHG